MLLGKFICVVGYDFYEGEVFVKEVMLFGYRYLVFFVLMNVVLVEVYKKLKIVIIVMGDELVYFGEDLLEG